jgi:hypothetical protein
MDSRNRKGQHGMHFDKCTMVAEFFVGFGGVCYRSSWQSSFPLTLPQAQYTDGTSHLAPEQVTFAPSCAYYVLRTHTLIDNYITRMRTNKTVKFNWRFLGGGRHSSKSELTKTLNGVYAALDYSTGFNEDELHMRRTNPGILSIS